MKAGFTCRYLERSEIERIMEIDRSEEIFEVYVYQNQQLELKPAYERVEGFSTIELTDLIQRQFHILDEGGKVIGLFDSHKLVGVTSLEKKRRGTKANYCKMDILYVSKEYRGMKIGSFLLEESKKEAHGFGAERIYISATPTKSTVDFYLKHGASMACEIDRELFALEPLDIHLEIIL